MLCIRAPCFEMWLVYVSSGDERGVWWGIDCHWGWWIRCTCTVSCSYLNKDLEMAPNSSLPVVFLNATLNSWHWWQRLTWLDLLVLSWNILICIIHISGWFNGYCTDIQTWTGWYGNCGYNYCFICETCPEGPGMISIREGCPPDTFCNADRECEGTVQCFLSIIIYDIHSWNGWCDLHNFHLADLATCQAGLDTHYRTFDDLWFDFQGVCKYNLASSTAANTVTPPFRIYMTNEYRWGNDYSYPRYFEFHVYDYVITTGKYGATSVSILLQDLGF